MFGVGKRETIQMGKLTIFLVLATVFLGYKIKKFFDLPPLPDKLEEVWWGPGKPGSVGPVVKPFTIKISDDIIKDLQHRLDNHRPFTPPLEGIQQQYGMNTNLLKDIVDYWRTEYDWKQREKYLNQYPQYTINIQGLDIHYIHVKPKVSQNIKILPLLLLHGWPGSVREFYDILPKLTTPQEERNFVFEVIAPSLPGFGFSKPAVRPGLSPDSVALVFKNMMHQLGFEKFYVQGGDYGAIVLQNMAVLYPEVVLGFHSNMCLVFNALCSVKMVLASIFPSFPSWYVRPEHYNRVFPVGKYMAEKLSETGYLHEQATKPDTIGAGLNDSPIGLAAYILEKFTSGTNITWQAREDGGLLEYFTYDDLLDNVMFYWIPQSITTSVRFYSETFNQRYLSKAIMSQPIRVPTACARFSYDLYTPDGMLKDVFVNLVQLNDFEGGHFAAMQLPDVLAKDIYDAVEKFEIINI